MPASSKTVACVTCGKVHPLRETELIYGLPDDIFELSEEGRAERAKTSPDICMLDGARMFLRGVIPLRVEGRERPYRIGAWAELAEEDFRKIYALWSDPNQASHVPFNGALANEIYGWPGSRGMALEIRLTGPTTRPDLYLVDPAHDLYRQQCEGVSEHQAYEYSARAARRNAV